MELEFRSAPEGCATLDRFNGEYDVFRPAAPVGDDLPLLIADCDASLPRTPEKLLERLGAERVPHVVIPGHVADSVGFGHTVTGGVDG